MKKLLIVLLIPFTLLGTNDETVTINTTNKEGLEQFNGIMYSRFLDAKRKQSYYNMLDVMQDYVYIRNFTSEVLQEAGVDIEKEFDMLEEALHQLLLPGVTHTYALGSTVPRYKEIRNLSAAYNYDPNDHVISTVPARIIKLKRYNKE